MAAATPDIAMVAATTLDSKGVTVAYEIKGGAITDPISFAIDRSPDGQVGPEDQTIGSGTVVAGGQPGGPTLDLAGQPADAPGFHQVTFPLPGGLPPDPGRPFVVVVADPAGQVAETSKSDNSALFRTYLIGVLVHGELQPQRLSWKELGPPWEQRMAAELRTAGYDAVIPYNWVAESIHPGAAARQGPKLAQRIADLAAHAPPGAPVDLHLISYGEGAVVASQALVWLDRQGLSPALQAGYIKMTMLDPRAANNDAPGGKQYSVKQGVNGWLARQGIVAYQARARDPLVVVPGNVAAAEVFYQHTPVGQTRETNRGLYNLWGQVPVVGRAQYFDLTSHGLSHSGNYNVLDWYEMNVVPTLGGATPYVGPGLYSARLVKPQGASSAAGDRVATVAQPYLAGTATPGARIKLAARRAGTKGLRLIGHAVTGPAGTWLLQTRPLTNGSYRLIAVSSVPASTQHQRARVRLRTSLGTIAVAAPGANA